MCACRRSCATRRSRGGRVCWAGAGGRRRDLPPAGAPAACYRGGCWTATPSTAGCGTLSCPCSRCTPWWSCPFAWALRLTRPARGLRWWVHAGARCWVFPLCSTWAPSPRVAPAGAVQLCACIAPPLVDPAHAQCAVHAPSLCSCLSGRTGKRVYGRLLHAGHCGSAVECAGKVVLTPLLSRASFAPSAVPAACPAAADQRKPGSLAFLPWGHCVAVYAKSHLLVDLLTSLPIEGRGHVWPALGCGLWDGAWACCRCGEHSVCVLVTVSPAPLSHCPASPPGQKLPSVSRRPLVGAC